MWSLFLSITHKILQKLNTKNNTKFADSVKQTYEHIAHENMLDKNINLENVPFSAPLMNYVQHSRTVSLQSLNLFCKISLK